mmetsp:Transcript_69137/g.198298  ORF Transcript_69137/g.198298 Transcript_69137/m.198298 type:complete len:208 (+) Transcript_69137:201-824(+)
MHQVPHWHHCNLNLPDLPKIHWSPSFVSFRLSTQRSPALAVQTQPAIQETHATTCRCSQCPLRPAARMEEVSPECLPMPYCVLVLVLSWLRAWPGSHSRSEPPRVRVELGPVLLLRLAGQAGPPKAGPPKAVPPEAESGLHPRLLARQPPPHHSPGHPRMPATFQAVSHCRAQPHHGCHSPEQCWRHPRPLPPRPRPQQVDFAYPPC